MKQGLSVAIALTIALAASASPAATLPPASHAYGFDGDLADELGGPAMAPILGTVHATNLRFKRGGGTVVDGAASAATYSVEMRVKLAMTGSVNSYYRLLDFKNRQTDNGLYVYQNTLVFYDQADGTSNVFSPDTWADVVITRDGETSRVVGYVDGEKQFSFVDTAGDAIFTMPDGLTTHAIFFQDDLDYPDENGPGNVDHVRFFDTVLTAADARALAHGKLPPNVTLK
jgi:hypothetical protein